MAYAIKIQFVPDPKRPSNYIDCDVVASDGSLWHSKDNRWIPDASPASKAIPSWEQPRKELSYKEARHQEALAWGCFAGFASMALIAQVFKAFDAPPIPWVFVVLAISAAIGVHIYRKSL